MNTDPRPAVRRLLGVLVAFVVLVGACAGDLYLDGHRVWMWRYLEAGKSPAPTDR